MHYQPQRHLLQDRIILVTGASDGIGREAALTYSRYSASVILVYSRPVNLHAAGVPAAGAENSHPLPAPRRSAT